MLKDSLERVERFKENLLEELLVLRCGDLSLHSFEEGVVHKSVAE